MGSPASASTADPAVSAQNRAIAMPTTSSRAKPRTVGTGERVITSSAAAPAAAAAAIVGPAAAAARRIAAGVSGAGWVGS